MPGQGRPDKESRDRQFRIPLQIGTGSGRIRSRHAHDSRAGALWSSHHCLPARKRISRSGAALCQGSTPAIQSGHRMRQHRSSNAWFHIACGRLLQVALQSAQELDDKDTWYRLGLEALKQGNHQIVEFSYQKTKNFERLCFLYLITGNVERLSKMLKIYEMYDDAMGRFQTALYVGDVRERVKILEDSGQLPLAYLTAKTHGLTEEAERLRQDLAEEPEMDEREEGLLFPPIPIMREANWPLLTVSKGFFDSAIPKPDSKQQARIEEINEAMEEIEAGGAWGEDDLDETGLPENDVEDEDEDGGWDMEVWLLH